MTLAADVSRTDTGRPAYRAWQLPILQTKAVAPIVIALGSLLAGAIYTWFAGEDVNWDWQNYHEYNVWALINGRYAVDALPAGFQTYFNPTVYFPVYYLRHLLPLPYGLMILGAVHGLNLLLIYVLSRVLLREAATAWAIGSSILIAAVGPMTLSEVGTSFSDILTALPILAGCVLILSAAIASRTLCPGRAVAWRGRRAEVDQCRLRAWCGGRGSRRDPPPDGDDLPWRGRRGRRAGDGRRVGTDALARAGQSDFPAVQRGVPVSGIGPDEYHGLAVLRRLPRRPGVSVLLDAVTTGARSIRFVTRDLPSRWC